MSFLKTVSGSPEQEAFWYELQTGESHIMLEARAGTGKTFSCIEGCQRYLAENHRAKIAMVAYNRSIAKELQSKVPEEVTACTMHSLGYAPIRHRWQPKVNKWKTKNILEDLLGVSFLELGIPFQISMRKVVSLAKNILLDFSTENYSREFDSMVSHYNLQLSGDEKRIKDLLPRVLEASMQCTSEIDFDDMIWLPIVLNMKLQKFDVLFVDEAQDLNKARQHLAMRSLAKDGRLIAVGDPKQAIYGFTGADAYSMRNLANMLSNVIIYPLTVTRRCPKSHVKLAQEIVKDIKPMDDAPEGTIKNMSSNEAMDTMKGGDLVLCRMNAPLMKVAYSLIQKDTPVTIQGRDIGAELANLCRKVVKGNVNSSIMIFLTALDSYYLKEVERLDRKAATSQVSVTQYEMLRDKVACLQIISEGLDTVDHLVKRIKSLFSDGDELGQRKRKVILSSVHRAKGLEAHTVYIVEPEKMPHPMAQLEWEIEQEYNIKYVAMTRSMDTLIFIKE